VEWTEKGEQGYLEDREGDAREGKGEMGRGMHIVQ
jgi:hypothetical protein